MKKTILPALAMLIVAAVMLSTASYAWFAISSDVTAQNMNVTIKSESEYLLIMSVDKDYETDDKDEVLADIRDTVNHNKFKDDGIAIGTTTIAPAAHHATTAADFADFSKWYTATGAVPGFSDMNDAGEQTLTKLDGYVVKYRYIVAMAKGSSPKDGIWLKAVQVVDTTPGVNTTIKPIKVVITCGDVFYEYGYTDDATGNPFALSTANFTAGAEVNDTVFFEFNVYVYYDGNHSAVTTDNFANISPANVAISLTTTNPNP